MENICWIKPIHGYEDYLITVNCAVWSTIANVWKKQYKDKEGYLRVNLKDKSLPIHRLLFETFVRPLKKGEIVHHLNENKTDNRLQNLIAMTRAEHNNLHKTGNQFAKGKHHFLTEETKQRMSKAKKEYWKSKI